MVRPVKFQDIEVPAPGYGTMSLSPTHGHTTDEAGHKALAKALAIGATFWDTARVYGAGHNETLIGEFFAQNPGSREKVFIASKCGFQEGVNDGVTNSPEHIRSAIKETIRCLGSAPDLYYLHRMDPNTKLEDSIGEMQKLKEEGLTRYIGLSEPSADTLRKACETHIDALQIEYSAFFIDHETDGLIDAAKELGVSIVAYSPLGKGMLTGTITDPSHFANDIRGTWPRYQAENFDANQRIVQQFGDLAKQKGVLPSQLAIAWVMAQGAIPIPGTRSAERVEENDKAGDIELSDEDLAAIRKVVEESKPQGDRYGELHMSLVGR